MKPGCNVATLIERYFTERLMRQRNASANTIASYRDTFRLLFMFAQARLRKPPSALALDDLDVPFISAFLADLETKRGAGVRTRNLRLTAIRSFFRFASFDEPAHSALIQRVLAMPSKRHDKRQVHFLTRPEIEAILAVPDRTTWLGRRDHTLLLLAAQTGLRLSELISLDRDAIHLGAGAHVRCVGKGRKERCTPLTSHARGVLQTWRFGCCRSTPCPEGHGFPADEIINAGPRVNLGIAIYAIEPPRSLVWELLLNSAISSAAFGADKKHCDRRSARHFGFLTGPTIKRYAGTQAVFQLSRVVPHTVHS
jgi:integrase